MPPLPEIYPNIKLISKLEFKDNSISEDEIIASGIKSLTMDELKSLILDKTIFGNYFIGRVYSLYIDKSGKMEGVNDLGTQDYGQCSFDGAHHTITVKWNNGWDNWVGRAYYVNNEIKIFNSKTGQWITTFTKIV